MTAGKSLASGEIGYIVTNLKSTREAKVGDTITLTAQPASQQLPGYKEVQPFVYAGFFPESNEYYQELKDAIEKLNFLASPHIESFDYWVDEGLKRTIEDIDPVEVPSPDGRSISCTPAHPVPCALTPPS